MFVASSPTKDAVPVDVRDPRTRSFGHIDPENMEVHKQTQDMLAVSASMRTALLVYSGITVKMMVDSDLGANLSTMFMVQYEPEGVAGAHDHPFEEVVTDWYDNVYIPLAETIRDRGLLRWFPDRTITDLYVWISENRAALEKELGWDIHSNAAITDLILERSVKAEPGSWRKSRTVSRYTDSLFMDILVPPESRVARMDSAIFRRSIDLPFLAWKMIVPGW